MRGVSTEMDQAECVVREKDMEHQEIGQHHHLKNHPFDDFMDILLRIQVSVQILIPLIFYSAQFILLIFHSCMHLQSASVCCVCCDYCDCIVSQECDSVTSALFQRLRYEFVCSSLFWTVSYFSFRQFVR